MALAIDGDTLQVEDWHFALWGYEWHVPGCRVRLWGASAPELREPFGVEAREALSAMLGRGAPVDCRDQRGTSYERAVSRCVLADGTDLADALVRGGWATDTPAYSGGHYAPAEAEARRHGRGMWGGD